MSILGGDVRSQITRALGDPLQVGSVEWQDGLVSNVFDLTGRLAALGAISSQFYWEQTHAGATDQSTTPSPWAGPNNVVDSVAARINGVVALNGEVITDDADLPRVNDYDFWLIDAAPNISANPSRAAIYIESRNGSLPYQLLYYSETTRALTGAIGGNFYLDQAGGGAPLVPGLQKRLPHKYDARTHLRYGFYDLSSGVGTISWEVSGLYMPKGIPPIASP